MVQWTAKQIQNNGIFYILWTAKDSSKQIGINGTTELTEEYVGEDLVAHVKELLGESLVTNFEQEATTIDDTPPGQI